MRKNGSKTQIATSTVATGTGMTDLTLTNIKRRKTTRNLSGQMTWDTIDRVAWVLEPYENDRLIVIINFLLGHIHYQDRLASKLQLKE